MIVKDEGRLTFSRFTHPKKTLVPMVDTPSLIVTSLMKVQLMNFSSFIDKLSLLTTM